MRRTKIVATLGPSSSDPQTISDLIDAGLNVARLNFSHGDHESHGKMIDLIRSIAAEKKTCVTILQDLCGPKIRLGILPDEGVELRKGELCVLMSEDSAETDALPVQYENLEADLKKGDRVVLADGTMELTVESIHGKRVVCRIVRGGIVFSRKGVNLPSADLSVVAFTEKDRKDLLFGLEKGVDVVALSFVRSAADLVKIRSIISKDKNPPLLIAKIEKPQAVKNIDEILPMVDGVMVARGDLGVEMPLFDVPVIQKVIIRKARREGKVTITATQMLKSMVDSNLPTRAECTDVANALFDGTCAVMLSEETASGKYPVEAVRVMDGLARATEQHVISEFSLKSDEHVTDKKNIAWAVGRSACWLAKDLEAGAVVAYTESGFTAASVARFRPAAPILALTPNKRTFTKLNMFWGVVPGLTEGFQDIEEMFSTAAEIAVAKGIAKQGDNIIITAGVPLGVKGSTNMVKVYEI